MLTVFVVDGFEKTSADYLEEWRLRVVYLNVMSMIQMDLNKCTFCLFRCDFV
jgi:hypothetical protein